MARTGPKTNSLWSIVNTQRLKLQTALKTIPRHTEHMGLKKCHGLRHAYAQKRYREISAQLSPNNQPLQCSIEGGTPSKLLTGKAKEIDRQTREIISRELGHSRIAITKIYIG